MQKITPGFVKQLNEETTSDNFESIVDKYGLDTPDEYLNGRLCEQDGIEVWGVTENKSVLVYDNVNGWYLLPVYKWTQEIRNAFDEEAEQILSEIPALNQPDKIEKRLLALEDKFAASNYPRYSTIQASRGLKECLDTFRVDGKKESFEDIIWRIIEDATKDSESK